MDKHFLAAAFLILFAHFGYAQDVKALIAAGDKFYGKEGLQKCNVILHGRVRNEPR